MQSPLVFFKSFYTTFIMKVGIAGPYSAETAEQRKNNLDNLNKAAAHVLNLGHIPLIGINAALPVLEHYSGDNAYERVMDISLAVTDTCEALILIAESPGANRERDLILSKGLSVFTSIEQFELSLEHKKTP